MCYFAHQTWVFWQGILLLHNSRRADPSKDTLETCQLGPHHWFKDGNMMRAKPIDVRSGTFPELSEEIICLYWFHTSTRMKSGMSLLSLPPGGYLRRKSTRNKADLKDSKVASSKMLYKGLDPTMPLLDIYQEVPIFHKPVLFLECLRAISFT